MIATFPMLLFAITALLLQDCFCLKDAIVEIESGVRIRGSQMSTLNQRKFFAFRGIPYAEPPVGELRFKPPVRKHWEQQFFDAREMGPWCVQMDSRFIKHIAGQEDCLVLNVYTPDVNFKINPKHSNCFKTKSPLKKVMVFIHGGGFITGSANQFGPRRLLDQNVVLVTINYRLGLFGFLSTLDKASPGNYGLLDQTEALKWVKRNIATFGGNPNKVTIIGQSAGSMSVMNHLISPFSSGLFQRAIGQSGTVLSNWSEQRNPLKWAKLIAETVGCTKSSTMKLVDCLRGISAESLNNAAKNITNSKALKIFSPVADGTFHSQLPSKLLRDGLVANKVPLLLGIANNDGLLYVPPEYSNSSQFTNTSLKKVLASKILNVPAQHITNDLVKLINRKYFNLQDKKGGKNLIELTGKLITDGGYEVSHYKAVQLLLASDVKLFVFSHDYITDHSILKIVGLQDFKGVVHMDDLFFLFDVPDLFPEDYQTPNDRTENNFLHVWTSFAEHGYPIEKKPYGIIKWKHSCSKRIYVYHMDKETKVRRYDPHSDWRLDFWLRKVPSMLDNATCGKDVC